MISIAHSRFHFLWSLPFHAPGTGSFINKRRYSLPVGERDSVNLPAFSSGPTPITLHADSRGWEPSLAKQSMLKTLTPVPLVCRCVVCIDLRSFQRYLSLWAEGAERRPASGHIGLQGEGAFSSRPSAHGRAEAKIDGGGGEMCVSRPILQGVCNQPGVEWDVWEEMCLMRVQGGSILCPLPGTPLSLSTQHNVPFGY